MRSELGEPSNDCAPRTTDKPFKPLDVAKELFNQPFWTSRWVWSLRKHLSIGFRDLEERSDLPSQVFILFDGRSRDTRQKIQQLFPIEKTREGRLANRKDGLWRCSVVRHV